MKKNITFLVMTALIFAMILNVSAKKASPRPPSFETAWHSFEDAVSDFVSNGARAWDTVAIHVADVYLKTNWTEQQITSNVYSFWPMPATTQAACHAHCTLQIRDCVKHAGASGWGTMECVDQYNLCDYGCHH